MFCPAVKTSSLVLKMLMKPHEILLITDIVLLELITVTFKVF